MTKTVLYSHIENWYRVEEDISYYRKGSYENAAYDTMIAQNAYEMHVFEDIQIMTSYFDGQYRMQLGYLLLLVFS